MTGVEKGAEHIRQMLTLTDAVLDDEYFYQNLPLCFIDVVDSPSSNQALLLKGNEAS